VVRGACALAVFLCHWHLWSDFTPADGFAQTLHGALAKAYDAFIFLTWPTGGHHPAVICFFVLSGFCIHYPFAQRAHAHRPLPGWRDYLSRRFRRIMPVFWTACLLGLVFVIVERRNPTGIPLLAAHATGTPFEIGLRFTGLSSFYPGEIFAGNYPLVTVAIELVIYAFYPLVHFHATRGRWVGLGLAFALLQVAAVAMLPYASPFWLFNSVLMFGLFWYLGALAAHLYVRHNLTIHGGWFLLAWLVFLAAKQLPHFYGLNGLRQDYWAVICALGILWGLRREARPGASRERPVTTAMRYLGTVSYSLYAMHTPAIMLATWLLVHGAGISSYLIQLGSTFTLATVATLATHYGVERVFYRPRS